PKPAEVFRGRGEHILYVDDEMSIVTLATTILEGLGYVASGETSPVRALKMFFDRPDAYDVVVTHFAMAGMSGLELILEIHQVNPQLPIILVSGYLTSADAEQALHEGAVTVLTKPDFIRELPRVLKQINDSR